MKLKVKLDEGAKMPTKAYSADAGFDIYAKTNAEYGWHIAPGQSEVFDTGVHVEIPRGYVGFLKSKSGLNIRDGIIGEGVIDSGYANSIRVKLYNIGNGIKYFHPGDKIIQLVILPIHDVELEQADEIECSERGDRGFGSSGR